MSFMFVGTVNDDWNLCGDPMSFGYSNYPLTEFQSYLPRKIGRFGINMMRR